MLPIMLNDYVMPSENYNIWLTVSHLIKLFQIGLGYLVLIFGYIERFSNNNFIWKQHLITGNYYKK